MIRGARAIAAAIALAITLGMWTLDARADTGTEIALPVVVERDGITVRAEQQLERDARRVAERAPRTLARIAEDLRGLPVPEHVDIRLVIWASDIAAASPAGARPPEWAAGVAYPTRGVVVIAQRSGPEVNDIDAVVDHELAHLALGAALDGRAPRWLDEGFAFLHSSEWSMARTQTLMGMAWGGHIIPWYEIDRRFPARENAASRAYAQSYDFVAFLARRGRWSDAADNGDRWPLREFLREIAAGKDVSAAAREAYGASFTDLTREWYEDLRARYLTLPTSLVGLAVWVIAALLLVLAYLRRRSQGRARLAQWEREEREHEAAAGGVWDRAR